MSDPTTQNGTDENHHREGLPLLNVFEVVTEGVHRHLVCFLDSILAGAQGIDERSVVGEFRPGPGGVFDPKTFAANPAFIGVLTDYMNDEVAKTEAIRNEAAGSLDGALFVLDPRSETPEGQEPAGEEVLGAFQVDDEGELVPGSFDYNDQHRWFSQTTGTSGVLADRSFYDWLHRAHFQSGGAEGAG